MSLLYQIMFWLGSLSNPSMLQLKLLVAYMAVVCILVINEKLYVTKVVDLVS